MFGCRGLACLLSVGSGLACAGGERTGADSEPGQTAPASSLNRDAAAPAVAPEAGRGGQVAVPGADPDGPDAALGGGVAQMDSSGLDSSGSSQELDESEENDLHDASVSSPHSEPGSVPAPLAQQDAAPASDMGSVEAAAASPVELLALPLVFAPTENGFSLNAVLSLGAPDGLRLRLRERASDVLAWSASLAPSVRGADIAQWKVEGLEANKSYDYVVTVEGDAADADGQGEPVFSVEAPLFEGQVQTRRAEGQAFTFALLSDTHVGSNPAYSNQGDPKTLEAVSAQLVELAPDFVVNLGDILDFHQYGFNVPPPAGSITRDAYLNYRTTFGATLGGMGHFGVIGGWDSESGCDPLEDIERSREQRLLYLPGPTPETYPQGGSEYEDYYAFTWGDALFVVLNVFTYTPTCHLLSEEPGVADDWTLGAEQLGWLQRTLEGATSKWRFVMIHHPVGGAGGDEENAAYGRGGGLAAYVGEQALVHEMMIEYGVQIFFYGHDHVFTDMVVDGVHYTLPGSAGAPWKFTEEDTGYTEYWSDSGWAKVDVSADSVDVQFVSVEGDVLYGYSVEP